MLHRRNLRYGQGWRVGNRSYEARKGMKIMAIVDRHGLPLSVSTHAANHHEVRLVQLCFDFYMIEAKPENARTRFIPDSIIDRFELCAWPEARKIAMAKSRNIEPVDI